MLPPPITVVGSAVSGAFIWLSYMTCPVVLFVIFIRNLSVPPPPLTCPSIAVSTNAYEPAPLMVPSPLYCALAPDIEDPLGRCAATIREANPHAVNTRRRVGVCCRDHVRGLVDGSRRRAAIVPGDRSRMTPCTRIGEHRRDGDSCRCDCHRVDRSAKGAKHRWR